MSGPRLVFGISALEASHVEDVVGDLLQLLSAPDPTSDPAVARLVPDAYADDSAAQEFRRLTESDLLARRRADADAVLESILAAQGAPGETESSGTHVLEVALTSPQAASWLRTLNTLRLVVATRLDIRTEDDHLDGDPRFALYDWLGYRLDLLVRLLADADGSGSRYP